MDRRRSRLAEQAPPGPIRDYLATPLPGPRTAVADLRLLAVDIETTGLDPRTDHILSVGFLPVDGLVIDLSGAEQLLCRAEVGVGQSAVVHGITDDALTEGIALSEVVERVAAALHGRVLLAHRCGRDEAAWPPPEDRAASDLLLPDRITDPWLRALTTSARDAAIPVVLGGHTLVGPGLRLALGGSGRRRRSAP